MSTISLDATERARLGRRAQLLAAASVSYNIVEAVIAITAGAIAGSAALVGFGLDSLVEVSSGLVILWQFRHAVPASRERQALRIRYVHGVLQILLDHSYVCGRRRLFAMLAFLQRARALRRQLAALRLCYNLSPRSQPHAGPLPYCAGPPGFR